MRLEIQEHGTIMADYFHGTGGVWLNIYCDKNTTKSEALEALKDEINNVWDHIESTAEYYDFDGDLNACIDEQIKKAEIFIKGHETDKINPDLDFDFATMPDDIESPVTIFTIEFLED